MWFYMYQERLLEHRVLLIDIYSSDYNWNCNYWSI